MTGGAWTLDDLFERGIRPFYAPPRAGTPLSPLPSGFGDFDNVWTTFVELRLGDVSGAVDFSWSQLRGDFAVPASIAGTDPWKALLRFGERWRDGVPELACVRAVVYEIDQEGGGFGAQPAVYFHRIKADPPAILALYRATNAMLGCPSSPEAASTLGVVLDHMPSTAIPLSLGYMLSRPSAPLRFVISEIEAGTALPAYLRAIGWPGEVADVIGVIAGLPSMAGGLHPGVSLDIGEGVGPRLGVEFTFRSRSDRVRLLGQVIEELIAAGLCHPAYLETIAAWTGGPPVPSDWLRPFLAAPDFHRIVSHFKLVFDGPAVEAKCYLECTPAAMLDAPRRGAQAPAFSLAKG